MEFNRLIPELSVANLDRSLSFYIDILRFKVEYSRPENKFAFLSYQGSQIMVEEINNNWVTAELTYPFGRGINFQFEVNNVDELLMSLSSRDYHLFRPVKDAQYRVGDVTYMQREFLVQDPDGYLLRFTQEM